MSREYLNNTAKWLISIYDEYVEYLLELQHKVSYRVPIAFLIHRHAQTIRAFTEPIHKIGVTVYNEKSLPLTTI